MVQTHNTHNKQIPSLNLIFRFILGLLGSMFISMILLKIIVNFYILMVLLFIASIITWQSLKKNTYPPQGKWIMYGVLSGFIALSIVLLIMIISVNVLFQGILQ